MSKDKVSVIMATYNCEKTVDRAIQSIIDQTWKDWVMIICDDGSTDNTYLILKGYEKEYPDKFVILKNEQNMQLPYSLNKCLEHVKTDLVARMDGDDWCDPTRFEKEMAILREHPEIDLVSTGVTVFDGEKVVSRIIKPEYPTKETVLKTNPFSHATVMTYKRVYDSLGGYSLDPAVIKAEDYELWCRFLNAGFVGYNTPEELYTILEDVNAAKRRDLESRIRSAKLVKKCLKSMGFKGWICYKGYLGIPKALMPTSLYRRLHFLKLKNGR